MPSALSDFDFEVVDLAKDPLTSKKSPTPAKQGALASSTTLEAPNFNLDEALGRSWARSCTHNCDRNPEHDVKTKVGEVESV